MKPIIFNETCECTHGYNHHLSKPKTSISSERGRCQKERCECKKFSKAKTLILRGSNCQVTLEPRPYYCDRGRFMVQIYPATPMGYPFDIDDADGFPRYYFDKERAKLEVEAFLKVRRWFLKEEKWEVREDV